MMRKGRIIVTNSLIAEALDFLMVSFAGISGTLNKGGRYETI